MVTHGSSGALVRYLREQGLDAMAFDTRYGEDEEDPALAEAELAEVLP